MKTILAAVFILTINACGTATTDGAATLSPANSQVQTMSKSKTAKIDNDVIEFRGTVQFISVEGGFYAIYADDGRKFTAKGFDNAYKKHGLVVQVKGKILKDVFTYVQHGEVLQIISVEVLDESNVKDINI